MFIKKRFSHLLSRFLHVCLESLQKVLIWPRTIFFLKKVSKYAEFHTDFKSVEKVLKEFTKKVLTKMWRRYALFPLLLMFVKLVLLICNYFWYIFLNFFNGLEISMKSCVFCTFFDLKKNVGHNSTLKPNTQKTAPKIRKVLSKCVSYLNFAPIKGSVFLIFFLKLKFVLP